MPDASSQVGGSSSTQYSNSSGYTITRPDPAQQHSYNYFTAAGYENSVANYANILKGYRDILSSYFGTPAQPAVGTTPAVAAQPGFLQSQQDSYGNLMAGVDNYLTGVGNARRTDIEEERMRQSGAAKEQLINTGMYNSSASLDAQRAIDMDASRSKNALSEGLAQLGAGYRANIGMQGLNAAGQAMGQATNAGQSYLGALSGYNIYFPSWPGMTTESKNDSSSTAISESYNIAKSNPVVATPGPPQGLNAGISGYQTVGGGSNPFDITSAFGGYNPWGAGVQVGNGSGFQYSKGSPIALGYNPYLPR